MKRKKFSLKSEFRCGLSFNFHKRTFFNALRSRHNVPGKTCASTLTQISGFVHSRRSLSDRIKCQSESAQYGQRTIEQVNNIELLLSIRASLVSTCLLTVHRSQSAILNVFVNRSIPYVVPLSTSSQAGTRQPLSAFGLVLVVGLLSFSCVVAILLVVACAVVKQRRSRRLAQRTRNGGNHVQIPSRDLNDDSPVVKATLSNGTNHETEIDADIFDVKVKSIDVSLR